MARWPGGASLAPGSTWRGAIVTPDGRTVVAVLELSRYKPGGGLYVGEQLAKFSTATGKVTATLNNLNVPRMGGYKQILYTNPSGNVLVVSNARPGMSAGP